MESQVKNLLRIIKYSPLLIILIVNILVIALLINEQKREIQEEKKNIEERFLLDEKERIKLNIDSIHSYIKIHKDIAEEELKKDLKSKINNIYKIISNIYINNKDTKSKDEIIEQIKVSVDTIRFNDGRGYFSIHTLKGINILHPINKDYEGKSVFNRKDFKGNYPVQEAINIAKTKGEGFFNWYSLKPNNISKEFEKIGIVKFFEPYGLVITTGEFREDFINKVKKNTLKYISKLKYKNTGYLFVIRFDGKIIYHPSKNAINGNIFQEKRFIHISDLFNNLISKNTVNSGTYLFITPKIIEGKDTKETKITYAKKIDEWKWIVSTSFKLSNVNKIIEKRKDILEKKYNRYKKDIFMYGLIFTIILIIISYYVSKQIEKKFINYKNNLEEQINENLYQKETLLKAQEVAHIGDWKLDLTSGKAYWSNEIIKIFGLNKKDENKFGPELLKSIMIMGVEC